VALQKLTVKTTCDASPAFVYHTYLFKAIHFPRNMKVLATSTLLAIIGQASAFAPSSPAVRGTSLTANVLEGTEIEKDLTPINNMLLVRKGDIIDKTEGGLFLTGKVSFNFLKNKPDA
jgi:hypothetical protein